jgi:hypothetical protein
MQPVKEKLNELKSNWGLGAGLTLMEIFDYDKLLIVINRLNCYQITEEEKLRIQAFPFAEVKSRIKLSFEVCCEIDTNISEYIETPFHLKNYLQSIADDFYNITDTIRGLNYIDELEKIGGFIHHDPFGFNKTQIENSRLVVDFLQANLTNYQNYQMVLEHAIACQKRQGFLTPPNQSQIENTRNSINLNSVSGPKAIGLTHREYLLIEKYKHDARYIPYPSAKDQKAISTGRYKKYYTVFSANRAVCKPANLKELQNIIPYLKDYPNAKKAAENDLNNSI